MSEERNDGSPEQLYLNVNAKTNALDYLESAVQFLRRSDDFKWKWAAIAVHHALYSFCILALDRGNSAWVTGTGRSAADDKGRFCKRGDETRWSKSRIAQLDDGPAYRIVWEETDEEPQIKETRPDDYAWMKGKLINIFTALARIQDERMMTDFASRPITITDEEMRAIQWLALKVRNEVIHFVPKFWGIEIEGIRCGCMAAMTVIHRLLVESQRLWTLDEVERERTEVAITNLRHECADK